MNNSIRLNICGRSSEQGDLLVELVADHLRHIKIEPKPSADGGLNVSLAIFPNAVDGGSKDDAELAREVAGKDDAMHRNCVDPRRVDVNMQGGLARNLFTQDQSSQIEKAKTDLSRVSRQSAATLDLMTGRPHSGDWPADAKQVAA